MVVVAFVIWSACAALLVGFAIFDRASERPAGFFANVRPPQVDDVKAYNRAVSNVLLVGAVVFELFGIPFLFLEQNSPGFLFVEFAVPFWAIGMMVAYLKVSAKHVKKP